VKPNRIQKGGDLALGGQKKAKEGRAYQNLCEFYQVFTAHKKHTQTYTHTHMPSVGTV